MKCALGTSGRRWAAYTLAALLPGLVCGLQMARVEQGAPLFLFFFAVVLATFAGGVGPGLVATTLSVALGNVLFLGPVGEFTVAGAAGRDSLFFAVSALTVTFLQGALRRSTLSLARALDSRDQFLAIAGHELNNPLAALDLQVRTHQRRLLRAGAVAPCPEDGLIQCERELATIGRLRALVDELLDVSRIRAGKLRLRPEPVDLVAIAEAVLQRFEATADAAGCALRLQATAPVIGLWDPLRLDQVLANLVGNAVKYGGGTPVTVRLDGDAQGVRINVSDEGPGISEADQRRIFARFERAQGTARIAGLGLGLWIVQQIVDACGGTIAVVSRPGAGATFEVCLPRRAAATP